MKNKKNVILLGYIILSVIYVFFSYMKIFSSRVNVNLVYLLVSLVYLAYFIITQKKISVYKSDIISMFFYIYLIITTFFINKKVSGIEFVIFFVIINFVYMTFRNVYKEKEIIVKLTFWATLFHSIMVIVQLLFPEIVLKICSIILKEENLQTVNLLYVNKYYSGVTVQAAASGLFATILIGISLSRILTNKRSSL